MRLTAKYAFVVTGLSTLQIIVGVTFLILGFSWTLVGIHSVIGVLLFIFSILLLVSSNKAEQREYRTIAMGILGLVIINGIIGITYVIGSTNLLIVDYLHLIVGLGIMSNSSIVLGMELAKERYSK
jgi:heme A synthase